MKVRIEKMAIGGTYNSGNSSNGDKKQLYENTYYSRIRVKNEDAKLALGFSYRSGLLIAEVSEIKQGFQYEALENIYISPTKALLLTKEIKKFKSYLAEGKIEPNKAFGVTTGMGEKVSYIGFHADKDKNILGASNCTCCFQLESYQSTTRILNTLHATSHCLRKH